MKTRSSRILFVFSKRGSDSSTAFGGFARRLKKRGGLQNIEIDTVALEDMMFEIDGTDAKVTDLYTGVELTGYDWVYFKSWEGMADRATAFAVYLHAQGIPFVDSAVINKGNGNKLVSHLHFWANHIPVARTVYCAPHHFEQVLPSLTLKYPIVIKAVNGQKGRSNFLAKDYDAAIEILHENPEVEFLIQEHIPNTHDLRVQVYGGKAALIMQRMAQEGSHLNNTSAGGGAQLIPLSEADPKMLELAERAAEAVDLQVAGVDVMPNSETGGYYILEANQGSQIVTGKFTDENMAAFNTYVRKQAKVRLLRSDRAHKKKLTIIGRHETVDLPDLGVDGIDAKVDTGAYHSSLHAEDVKLISENGKEVLTFSVLTENGPKQLRFNEFSVSEIIKSPTYSEHRYVIQTRVRIGGRSFVTSFTLTNRNTMKFPVLIGRRVMRGRFIVNPEISQKEEKKS